MDLIKPKPRKQYTVKLNGDEKAALQKKADEFAQGNLSNWLRYAGLNHTPKK